MGLPGMVLSAIAATAGAIMYWAVTYQGTGFRLSTVGLIPIILGAIGFVVSAIIFTVSRNPVTAPPNHESSGRRRWRQYRFSP